MTDILKLENKMDKEQYIISQLINKKCDGGCATEFYFSYDDSHEREYQRDNLICTWPANINLGDIDIDGCYQCCFNCRVVCDICKICKKCREDKEQSNEESEQTSED